MTSGQVSMGGWKLLLALEDRRAIMFLGKLIYTSRVSRKEGKIDGSIILGDFRISDEIRSHDRFSRVGDLGPKFLVPGEWVCWVRDCRFTPGMRCPILE